MRERFETWRESICSREMTRGVGADLAEDNAFLILRREETAGEIGTDGGVRFAIKIDTERACCVSGECGVVPDPRSDGPQGVIEWGHCSWFHKSLEFVHNAAVENAEGVGAAVQPWSVSGQVTHFNISGISRRAGLDVLADGIAFFAVGAHEFLEHFK